MASPNPKKRHVVVIGAGALGSWTAWNLNQAGCAVTLLDMTAPGQVMSSSGGETRVIRATYGPYGHYTAMIREALQCWRALEAHARVSLFHQTGVLWLHSDEAMYIKQAEPHLKAHGFPLEKIPPMDLNERFAVIQSKGLNAAFFEPEAGVLMARQGCQAVVQRGLEAGVTYQRAKAAPGRAKGEKLLDVCYPDGVSLAADDFVFACGPWLGRMFSETLCPFLVTSRQEVCFFKTPTETKAAAWQSLPIWVEFGSAIYYGLPDVAGGGLKMALDERGGPIDPDRDERRVSDHTIAQLREFLSERFPGLSNAPLIDQKVCQYTNTPDGELLLDRHPLWRNVWLLGGGSGHAYKLAPVVGRLAAAQVLGSAPPVPRWQLQGRLAPEKNSGANQALGSNQPGALR